MFVFCHVALGKETSIFFVVSLSKESFGQEGGVRGDVVGQGIIDGFSELSLECG